ncbi:glycyl-radical enzyme activating protein [Coriobacterium glomerans]|nr:glycyl-radical enzyme activating protein [Coriobacterium glomerans]
MVFNIQKFSLNDGPGIRTVVFLKGCPMRCPWCSNPESQLMRPQLEWSASACTGCKRCLMACPDLGDPGAQHIDVARADASSERVRQAVRACPARALSIAGRLRSAAEVCEICLKDDVFYQQSGGGVTLSGGEPLMWPEFCIELMNLLHSHSVDTCIETTACAAPKVFDEVAKRADHLLIDMKHGDSDRHRAATGEGLSRIWSNTIRAHEYARDVLVRTPVIPGFNDSVADARLMGRRLRRAGADRVQLLPYHSFGESKYASLGRSYDMRGQANLHEEDLAALIEAYREEGIEAFV